MHTKAKVPADQSIETVDDMTIRIKQQERFIADLAYAIRSHLPLPAFPADLTLEEAYSVLPAVASLVCDVRSSGIKAGFTNPDLQKLFGLEEPLLGLLYDWGECRSGCILPYNEHSKIECELGIVFNADGVPVSMGPAIEFVHLSFSIPEDLTPANLVVSSLGADGYLRGEQTAWAELDFESLRDTIISLERDGEDVVVERKLGAPG